MKSIHYESLKRILEKVFLREQERDFIRNINRLALSYQGYRDFGSVLCSELRKLVNFDYFSMVSRIELTGEYYLYFSDLKRNIQDFQRGMDLTARLESFLYGEVSKSRKTIIKNDVQKNSRDGEMLGIRDGEVLSYVAFPLYTQDAFIGCINMVSKGSAHFTGTQEDILGQVSTQIAITVMNAMLRDSLTASQEKYRDFIEHAPEIIFEMDRQGKFFHINRMGLDVLGYTVEEISTMYLFDLVVEEYIGVVKERYGTLVNSRENGDLTATLLTKDGRRFNVKIFCSVHHDKALNRYMVRGFIRDVAERYALEKKVFEYQEHLENLLKEKTLKLSETEKEMYHQKKFLDALVQNTNVYVIMITAKGKIVFVNHAIEKKFGYPLKEILGKSVVDVFIPQDKVERLLDDIQMLLSGTCGDQVEIPFSTRDCKVRDILWNVTYFKDELGILTNINLFGYDITEQNVLKEQLIQADKMSSLGTMISGIAHELNNPLSVIINFSELMMMCEHLTQSATERLQRIIDASQRCARIVENLLKFATKRKTIRKEQYVCINDVLKEALELVIHSLQVNNIEVEQSLSQTLPKTVADRVQLMQVFINLINNAQDAMKNIRGKAVLSLRTFQKRDKIIIEFEDTGSGIQDPEKLFTPFYTTKEVGKGTGLGLAVSYGIIKEHGGIIVGSNSQRGAVFTVTLPIKSETKKEIPLPVIKRDYDLNGLQVLLVEDEISIAESCSEFLTTKGCRVTSASSAKDAVLAIQKDNFDVVIMDLKMPGEMSGIQLYEWMMCNVPALKGKVILMTGDTLSSEFRVFIEKNHINVVPKPFQFHDLLDKICRTIKEPGVSEV